MNSSVIIEARSVSKVYSQGERELKVLRDIDLKVHESEALCIVGASGAGKSTLLHILGTLDKPTRGQVFFQGKDLVTQSDSDLAKFRNQKLGFVFQFHHLLSEFTALENVMMPVRISGATPKLARLKAEHLLVEMGLADRLHHFPSQLSGGEKQRVAIARALVNRPDVLLADEPTGNLDTENTEKIQELFFSLKLSMGLTLVVVTHDRRFARNFNRVLEMQDGSWKDSKINF